MRFEQPAVSLSPYPKTVSVQEGRCAFVPAFRAADDPDGQWQAQKDGFANVYARLYGMDMHEGEDGIRLLCQPSMPTETYTLRSRPGEAVQITFGDRFGLCRAFATLFQLLSRDADGVMLPCVDIEDAPDRGYRGLMVDLARQRHTVDALFRYVDLCYLYKINYLHFHFTDSEAFSLPTDVFPTINQKHWCYSRKTLRSLGAYAAARGVAMVPEIEMPGHAGLLVQDAGCGLAKPENHAWTLCPGHPGAMDKLKALIREVCELFPDSPYLHIGGDEVNTYEWEHCPECQAFCQEHGLSSGELYSYFIGEMAGEVLRCGKRPIVWEGFPQEGIAYIPKETIVNVFETMYHMPGDLVAEGYDIINTSWKPLYNTPNIHWPSYDILAWTPFQFQSDFSISEAYYNPMTLPETEKVLGAQFCSWEDQYTHEFPILRQALPALSERVWNLRDRFGSLNDFARSEEVWRKLQVLWD